MASRSRSRSPIAPSGSIAQSGRASPALSSTSGMDKESKKYQLTMNSIPILWTYHQVSSYIKKHTNQIDKGIADDIVYINLKGNPQYPDTQQAIITFASERSRDQAFDRLKATFDKIEGRKLYVKKTELWGKNKSYAPNNKFVPNNLRAQNKPFRYVTSTLVDYKGEEKDTYGLSASYLEDMGITAGPLTTWVFVRGLPEDYNDETKVREAFGRAGFIVSVTIIASKNGNSYNARIEYDHPVEAVQAVSMFNHREVLGCKINCEMDFAKKKDFINGVTQGPGLGADGKPMRGVRVSVEVKKLKNEFMQEIAKINDSLDELKAQVTNLYMEVEQVKAEKKNALVVQNTPSQNVSNPLAALGNILTNQLQPLLLQGLVQQTANDVNPLANLLQNLTGGNNLSNLLQPAQSGANIQSGPDSMLGGSNNMQTGLSNMQSGPNNMQTGLSNMQSGPNNMQTGLSNMQSGPNNMPMGPSNMQGGPNNMQGGPNVMQNSYDSFGNMQSGAQNQSNQNSFNQTNNTGFNTPNQPKNFVNLQSNFGPNNQMKNKVKYMKCFKCGGMGHKSHTCQTHTKKNLQTADHKTSFDLKLCHKCSMPGHLAHECWNKPKQGLNHNQNNNQQQSGGMGHSTMLLFNNLPPAVTYQVLQGKMLEVGEVKLVEMTGPGRALVGFCYEQDAEKCIRLFNESKVDGQTILVKRV